MSLKFRTLFALLPLFCAFGLLLLPGTPAFAQSASISGRVIDPSSAVVRKAQITFTDLAKGTSQTTQTNDGGFYSLPFVQPGTYTLAVESSGFKRFERTKITVETAQSLVVDVRLQVGNVSQSVTVDGSGNYINTTDARVSTVIDRQFVQDIPLNGRSFQSLLTMVPGVSVVPSKNGAGAGGEFTVNGQRTEENYFTVDGVSVNTGASQTPGAKGSAGFSGSVPGETALGTTQSMVSIDALQEFRATTSTYSADYGRSPGGQFIFQTRSGTKDWHGSAFEYLRNDALDANNYFNKYNTPITPRQAERQNDFGGTLGGPVIIPHVYNGKDRTFFFFSYEGLRLQQPQATTLNGVPSLSLRASAPAAIQPFLNAFPLPNGADFGNGEATFTGGYSAPASIDTTSIRIDHHFGDKFQVFGRYSDVPSNSAGRATGSDMAVVETNRADVKSMTLGATNTLTSRLTSDLRFNATWNNVAYNTTTDSYGGATPLSSQFLNSIPGYPQGKTITVYFEPSDWIGYPNRPTATLAPYSNDQHQVNIVESMNAALGRHNLKWGIDYRRLLTSGSLPAVGQTLNYDSVNTILSNQPQMYVYVGPAQFTPIYTSFSAFLQDEWKVTSRLNLSLGVRWELNPAPKDAHGENPYAITTTDIATLALAPKNTLLWQTTYGNFAPRFGLAYQLHQQPGHETVLRAGAGIFYDASTVNGSFGYAGQGLTNAVNISEGTATFPLTQTAIDAIPAPNAEPPYTGQLYGFDPHLKLPYTWEWNLALEQALGPEQTLTLSYVGSAGRRLFTDATYYPTSATNPNFDGATLNLTTNSSSSDYDAMQVQFQRKMSHNLQVLASYTWSHSLDNDSTNFGEYGLIWADSDLDVRNNFQLGMVYQVPGSYENKLLASTLKGWAVDARISSRSALPLNIYNTYTTLNGQSVLYQADRIPDQPVYLYGSQYPGGRIINYAAFRPAVNPFNGTAGRNSVRGFGATQADLAVNRTFPISERLNLRFRAEAYNVFNQAVMGTIYNGLYSGASEFGRAYQTENYQLGGLNSLYQVGGPRSLQLSLHLQF